MLSILILLLIIPLFVQMLDRRGVFVRFVILIRGILVLVFEFIVRDTDAPGRIEHPEHGDNLLCQCLALGADKMEFFGEVVEIEVRHFSLVTVIGIVYRDRNVIFRTAQQLHQMSVTDKLRVIALAGRHLVYQLLDKLVGLFPFLFLAITISVLSSVSLFSLLSALVLPFRDFADAEIPSSEGLICPVFLENYAL